MNSLLAKKLIEKGAIRQGTVFEATYKAYGLSCTNNNLITGEFILHSASVNKDGVVVFQVLDETSHPRRIDSDSVSKMDGMDIQRVAEIYSLAESGSDVKAEGKRRGRKPKASL
jgi:hypothetical protein